MELVTPDLGLAIWTTVAFLIVLFLLKKFAWSPILTAVKEREVSIETALHAADKAKEELEKLQAANQDLLKEARLERDKILKEAKEAKEKVIRDAKAQAKEDADLIVKNARQSIENEKSAAVNQLRAEVGRLSIEIAEKLLNRELGKPEEQEKFAQTLLKDVKLN